VTRWNPGRTPPSIRTSPLSFQRRTELSGGLNGALQPGKHLPPHRGPYKGLLRVHLAIDVPVDAEACWIEIDGTPAALAERLTHSSCTGARG
jgi:hypothetical protein